MGLDTALEVVTYTTFTEETNFLGSVDCDHDPAGISTTLLRDSSGPQPAQWLPGICFTCMEYLKKIQILAERLNILSPLDVLKSS